MKKKILAVLLIVLLACQLCLPALAAKHENIYMVEIIYPEDPEFEALWEAVLKAEAEKTGSEEAASQETGSAETESQETVSEKSEEKTAEAQTTDPEQTESESKESENKESEGQTAESEKSESENTANGVVEKPEALLCMKKSADGGIHWSEPKLISVKADGEQNPLEAEMKEEGFEAAVIEAAGRLYLMTNYGSYYYSEDEGDTWSARQSMEGFYSMGCQLLGSSFYEPAEETTSIFLTLMAEEEQCKKLGYLVQEDGTLLWNYEYVEIEKGAFYEVERADAQEAPEITQHADRSIAMVSSVLIDEEASAVLHHHNQTGEANSAEKSFQSAYDEELFIENAEFVFTQTDEGWSIYNQYENVYLDLDAADHYFGESEWPIHIEVGADGCFRIKSSSGPYAIFNAGNMTFDRWDTFTEADVNIRYDFTFLKWSENGGGDEVIPGYVKAAPENGGSYLIAYVGEGGVFVLYPTAPQPNQTKLCTVKEAERKAVITMIGMESGMTTAVVDGVTYEISVVPPTIPRSAMKVTAGSQGADGGSAGNAIDGEEETVWHTADDRTAEQGYEELWIMITLDDIYAIDEVHYLPCQSDANGMITEYKLLVSVDGTSWSETLPKGWAEDFTEKAVRLATPVNAKYVKLQVLDSVSEEGMAYVSAAELRLIGMKAEEIY